MVNRLKEFFGFQDAPEEDDAPIVSSDSPPKKTTAFKSFKGNLGSGSKSNKVSTSEIIVEEPRIYEDSLHIATYLRENSPVIVNLKHLDTETGKRLIDFICGTAYAINGHMMKIGDDIFLFTPETIRISNDDADADTLSSDSQHDNKASILQEISSY